PDFLPWLPAPESCPPGPAPEVLFPIPALGGGGWIRTNVGVSQQIYSLPPLATRAPLQGTANYGPRGNRCQTEVVRPKRAPSADTRVRRTPGAADTKSHPRRLPGPIIAGSGRNPTGEAAMSRSAR